MSRELCIMRETINKEKTSRQKWERNYGRSASFTEQEEIDRFVEDEDAQHGLCPANYIVPGYAGKVPGYNFTFGKRYGVTTSLLGATQKGRVPMNATQVHYPPAAHQTPISHRRERQPSFGGRIPGYGGFVPGGQFTFAKTYGRVTTHSQSQMMPKYQQQRQLRSTQRTGSKW